MTPEQILKHPPRVLTQEQREFYFENGYVLLEEVIPRDWMDALRKATDEVLEDSKAVSHSDAVWDLEPDHSPSNPRLRRLSSPVDYHPVYMRYIFESLLGDIAADLVGPDVKYHHTKLNFKAPAGGADIKWHQDIQFWPHTNYSPLTLGTYLYDCGMEQGPLGVIPRSHELPLFDLYNEQREWTGHLRDEDAATLDLDSAEYLCGPAGSVTVHNSRTVHGSPANRSNVARPLLLSTMTAADAFPYTHNPIQSPNDGSLVRGEPARWSYHDPRPCQIPPDWSGGYTSIFDFQQRSKQGAM